MTNNTAVSVKDSSLGALIGLAVGDAVGTTLEFKPRGTFEPINDMIGGGPFKLQAGEWTDDTSMALCLAKSLIHCKGFDASDLMNRFCNWYRLGYMSSNGECFDIGMTVSTALRDYEESKNPFSGPRGERSAGNGSIMRLAPVPIFYRNDFETAIEIAGESSRTTHGALECIDASKAFCAMLIEALGSDDKLDIITKCGYSAKKPKIAHILSGDFLNKDYMDLTGSGYVVESLESALWCFYHTHSFEEAILKSANIGNDADTTAAICGQIAGAYYGLSGIPDKWKAKLVMYDQILVFM